MIHLPPPAYLLSLHAVNNPSFHNWLESFDNYHDRPSLPPSLIYFACSLAPPTMEQGIQKNLSVHHSSSCVSNGR